MLVCLLAGLIVFRVLVFFVGCSWPLRKSILLDCAANKFRRYAFTLLIAVSICPGKKSMWFSPEQNSVLAPKI